MNNVKEVLPRILTVLRQEKNWTQSEVAEKLNYSDKAVSKWENGDAIPPIDVLKDIADLYEVSLDYLVTGEENASYDKHYTSKSNNPNKIIITLLATSIVWIITTILFIYAKLITGINYWIIFVGSVPVSFIVLLIFNCIWGKRKLTFVIISVLIWTVLATVYLNYLEYNPWALFIIGAPLQIATVLWSKLKKS